MKGPVFPLPLVLVATLLVVQGAMAQPAPPPQTPGAAPQAPHLLLERLSRMSPEQRQKMLERLPTERRARVESRLRELENMSPEARERLRREYNQFQQLPPEKRQEIRGLFRQFSDVPPERRRELTRELARLRRMPSERRAERIGSDQFRSQYNEQEREVLERLSNELPPLPTPGWRDARPGASGPERQQGQN